MNDDFSYKVSFAFALILHLILIFFLLVKFSSEKIKIVAESSVNIINAVAIDERSFKKQVKKKVVPKPKKPVVKKAVKKKKTIKKNKSQSVLKKEFLVKQKQEVARLKKERAKHQKDVARKKEEKRKQDLHKEILEEKKHLAAQISLAHDKALQKEVDKIAQAINLHWIKPEGVEEEDFCLVLINIAPDGEVLGVKPLASSGNLALDRSSQAAVLKASPLPVPRDSRLFNRLRAIKVRFYPKGVGAT